MTTTLTARETVTSERVEHGSAWGHGNITVMHAVTCTVCGGHGRFGYSHQNVLDLVALWNWHGQCRTTPTTKDA